MFGQIKTWLKANWGFGIFFSLSLIALIRLLKQQVPGHYRIFTGAGHALYSGINPHGTDYGTGVGYWFYSPSCGLFFFGPISLLPEKLGLVVYMGLSWLVFVAGVFLFTSALLTTPIAKLRVSWMMNLFWLGIAPQIFTGILASKLEIIMTGLLLIAAKYVITARQITLTAFILAMIINWKFQPLPSVALLLVTWLFLHCSMIFPLLLVCFLAFWFLLPFVVLPTNFTESVYLQWNNGLSAFVRVAWLDFDNIFSFLRNTLGLQLSFVQFQAISIFAGTSLGFLLLVFLLSRRQKIETHDLLKEGVAYSLSAGAAYTVAFSPLSQNNSYILYAPLLLICLIVSCQTPTLQKRIFRLVTGIAWLIMTFAYSDLVPVSLRINIRHWGIKPVACFGLLVCLVVYFFKSRNNSKYLLAT